MPDQPNGTTPDSAATKMTVKGPGHCAECSPELGVHCGYHCGFFLAEVERVAHEQNVTERQAEDVVMRRLRAEAVARRGR